MVPRVTKGSRKCEAASHVAFIDRKQRERWTPVLSSLSLFIWSRIPGHRMVLPISRVGLPISSNQISLS